MKLYLLFGDSEDIRGGEFRYLYGCFSTKEKAEEIKINLEENPNKDETELFVIEEEILDEPTDLYYFMMEP